MKTFRYPLIISVALAASMATLIAGCNRQDATPPGVPATASTTVGTEIDDTVVTAKVKSALLGDQDVKGYDIKVATRKGQVQLSGFVDNLSQVERAITVARAVEGVKDVENSMTLKDGKATVGNKVDDGITTARVKAALLAEPSIKIAQIAVVTRKGEVQLSGFVDSQLQMDLAISAAKAVEGVQSVINEMKLKQ
jgi:hyperosmotically inducible protein